MNCLDDLKDFYAFYGFYDLQFTAYRLLLTTAYLMPYFFRR